MDNQTLPSEQNEPAVVKYHGPRRRRLSTVGECAYCDAERNGSGFHPSHDASDRCESGKHNHCTCDTCF